MAKTKKIAQFKAWIVEGPNNPPISGYDLLPARAWARDEKNWLDRPGKRHTIKKVLVTVEEHP